MYKPVWGCEWVRTAASATPTPRRWNSCSSWNARRRCCSCLNSASASHGVASADSDWASWTHYRQSVWLNRDWASAARSAPCARDPCGPSSAPRWPDDVDWARASCLACCAASSCPWAAVSVAESDSPSSRCWLWSSSIVSIARGTSFRESVSVSLRRCTCPGRGRCHCHHRLRRTVHPPNSSAGAPSPPRVVCSFYCACSLVRSGTGSGRLRRRPSWCPGGPRTSDRWWRWRLSSGDVAAAAAAVGDGGDGGGCGGRCWC